MKSRLVLVLDETFWSCTTGMSYGLCLAMDTE